MLSTSRLDVDTAEVLLTVERLEPNAYAVPIRERLSRRFFFWFWVRPALSTVYIYLVRLEQMGFVKSRTVAGGPERGNHEKVLWFTTESGRSALEAGA